MSKGIHVIATMTLQWVVFINVLYCKGKTIAMNRSNVRGTNTSIVELLEILILLEYEPIIIVMLVLLTHDT